MRIYAYAHASSDPANASPPGLVMMIDHGHPLRYIANRLIAWIATWVRPWPPGVQAPERGRTARARRRSVVVVWWLWRFSPGLMRGPGTGSFFYCEWSVLLYSKGS